MTDMVFDSHLFFFKLLLNYKLIFKITTGIFMNLVGLLTIFIASNTWLGLIFDLNTRASFNSTLFLNSTNI